jgi:hypothetical protein
MERAPSVSATSGVTNPAQAQFLKTTFGTPIPGVCSTLPVAAACLIGDARSGGFGPGDVLAFEQP